VGVFARGFSDPALRAALVDFYARVGGLDYAALEAASYAVSRCPRCGSHFQAWIPDDDLLHRLYEEWIDPSLAFERFHASKPAYASLGTAREVALCLALAPTAPRVALDYGCGWGEWSLMVRAFGLVPWGTELSASRREHAASHGVKVADESALPGGAFGLVNADQVLEHVPDPATTMRLLAGTLHPQGILRIAVPNGLRVAGALRHFDREIARPALGRVNAIAPLEHLNAFTQAGLMFLAQQAGLERVRPPWSSLLSTTLLPPTLRSKVHALLRGPYLRSRFTTTLYFGVPGRDSSA
jgi:SAM-dependent methyltransferase